MKITFITLCLFLSLIQSTFAQGLLNKADSLYNEGQVILSIEAHQEHYKADSSDYNNVYNLACAFAQVRVPDSAFKYLYIAANLNSVEAPLSDPDFLPLKKDKRWDEFENNLIALIQKKYDNPITDVDYARKLWRMHALDQALYHDIDLAEKKINRSAPIIFALWDIKEQYNLQNQKELEALIAKKGWPKISEVGSKLSFLDYSTCRPSQTKKVFTHYQKTLRRK
jgi:hypothetical protein